MTRSNTWIAIGLLTAGAGMVEAAAGNPQLTLAAHDQFCERLIR